jgi:hypothetical protein
VQIVDIGEASEHDKLTTREDDLRNVEDDLRNGRVEHVSEALTALPGAHQGKRKVRLASGLECIAKPAGGIADWPFAAQCEAAAWTLARWLDLWGLVPVTVLRDLKLPDGATEFAALQVWLDTYDADRWEEDFPEEELDWAGVFDYLIQQTDRDGHNWLVWRDEQGRPHLRLPDNGYAFGAPNRAFSSQFSRARSGQPLSDEMLAALQRLKDTRFVQELRSLLPQEHVNALLGRVDLLLVQRRLP